MAVSLYTAEGRSHIAMSLYVDETYSSMKAYLASELEIDPKEIERLRELYLA